MKTALTIAGSDCSGGAGIQADLKTMTALGVYGMSAVTSITVQNTMGVKGVCDVSPELLENQLEAVFTDIFPDSVKIGMVSSAELIHSIAKMLKKYNAKNIVLDPVMVSTSGHSLLVPEALTALTEELFPLATVITPNVPEAQALCGTEIHSEADMLAAAALLRGEFPAAVLLKGGHLNGNDLLMTDEPMWIRGERINNPNTHGTGCTLSSAIAAGLAQGYTLQNAVCRAKKFIDGAIRAGLNLGHGRGPLNHMWNLKEKTNGI